jgi:hypothetical protein
MGPTQPLVQATHSSTQGQATGKINKEHVHNTRTPGGQAHTETLMKITGSIPRNTERTVANTTQGKLCKTQKKRHKNERQWRESLLTASTLLYFYFNEDI